MRPDEINATETAITILERLYPTVSADGRGYLASMIFRLQSSIA